MHIDEVLKRDREASMAIEGIYKPQEDEDV